MFALSVRENISSGLLLVFLLGFSSCGFSEESLDVDALVAGFFPLELISESDASYSQDGADPFRAFAYAYADLDGSGKAEYIVAAYTNGFSGAVRVIKRTGLSHQVIAAPSFPYMGGVYPDVAVRDLDDDGASEVIVSFSSPGAGGYGADWVLSWNDSSMTSIGPVATSEKGEVYTLLTNAFFADITGDGKVEIVSASVEQDAWYEVYKLSENGVYEEAGGFYELYFFRRTEGVPEKEQRLFSIPDAGKDRVVTIINGYDGGKRVSSAVVELNGETLFSGRNFNQNTKIIKKLVMLEKDNVLDVTLFGAPDGVMAVAIGPDIDSK